MNSVRFVSFTLILNIVLIVACSMQKGRQQLARLIPDTLVDWEIGREDQVFNRENLYTYINGGAELYRSYGFQEMINRTYTRSGQPDIVVDIFNMGSSVNAYGVFSHSRESIEADFGQGSEYYAGFLHFWRDRYLVSILASPETAESKPALEQLAREIETAIGRDGPLPEILKILPEEGLVEESVRYFRHHVWMNSYYFIAEENILNINDQTDALLARYGGPEQRYILLLVKYQNEAAAEAAYGSFAAVYLPELAREPTAQVEDGTWTAGQVAGNLLTVVFNAPSQGTALNLIGVVQENYAAFSQSNLE